MSDAEPVKEPGAQASGLELGKVFEVAALLRQQLAFTTACGLRGRSVLDYPGGFAFSGPVGAKNPDAATEFFLSTGPVYQVWSGPEGARLYTVAWRDWEGEWHTCTLDDDAPVEVRRHQWLVLALTHPRLPVDPGQGVVG